MANILFFVCPALPTPYRAVNFNIGYILSSNKRLKKKKKSLIEAGMSRRVSQTDKVILQKLLECSEYQRIDGISQSEQI